MYLITACIRIINNHSFEDVYSDLKWLEAETQNEDGNIFSLFTLPTEKKVNLYYGKNGKIKNLLTHTLKCPTPGNWLLKA